MNDMLRVLRSTHPLLFDTIEEQVTVPRIVEVLRAVADTPALSQTASSTRGKIVAELIEKWGLPGEGVRFTANLAGSGCDVLSLGQGGVRMVAHLDEISYLVAGKPRGGAWPLVAYCYHLADGPRDARVIRYTEEERYATVSTGTLYAREDRLWYAPDDGIPLQQGDRVGLSSSLQLQSANTRVTGSLDNAAGVTSVLFAAKILTSMGIPFSVILTDEEEGPSGSASQTISRGATRVLSHLPPVPLTVVTDVHGLSYDEHASINGHRLPWGASLAEYSSAGRGSVTPPPLYRRLCALADELREMGIRVRENIGGYIPRSDDVAAMMHGNAVCLLGFPGSNRHFDHGLPAANVGDLAHLAKALAVVAAVTDCGILESVTNEG